MTMAVLGTAPWWMPRSVDDTSAMKLVGSEKQDGCGPVSVREADVEHRHHD